MLCYGLHPTLCHSSTHPPLKRVEDISQLLVEGGYSYHGKDYLTSGITGEGLGVYLACVNVYCVPSIYRPPPLPSTPCIATSSTPSPKPPRRAPGGLHLHGAGRLPEAEAHGAGQGGILYHLVTLP